ncbi:hypothetical protein MMUR_29110 [Mycolicibacterium murale]|uniref:Gamma-glutamyl-gamma-aminobutyrate hydrolase n=1 Tax=Mycolicibacterium murale TaxID=182220 RepID=A0A7I9WM20_9MYCO|nr:hypothetical protein MMUR_29110 [Mycolicibacterium murale]
MEKVVAAGGVPLLIPPQVYGLDAVAAVIDGLDALVLIGGEDVCGTWSGRAESDAAHQTHSVERDEVEIALAREAWNYDLPMLGICRGLQVMNVSRGGTLIEDLPSAGASSVHRLTQGTFHSHPVTYDPQYLAKGYFDPDAHVPSHHHQAIDVLGDGLTVVGRADDDVIEAVEAAGKRFVVGVQWHPEEALDNRLFDALVAAAR